MTRWLVVSHRWLAILTCLLFVLWFGSGLVMMYVGFPGLSGPERARGLPGLRWSDIRVEPDAALEAAGLSTLPSMFRLEMMAGEPVYRIRRQVGGGVSVSAADGRVIREVPEAAAREIARMFGRNFAQSAGVQYLGSVERDQWTVAGTFDGHRPLYRYALGDAAGTQVYVSSYSGEVMLDTTRRERVWNWAGAVVHWIYFRDLRANAPVWRQVVLWLSGIAIVVAITGIWLGIDRLRVRRRNGGALSVTPFRGWMAWHHVAGVVGGVFVLTWMFSGWYSMGPPVPWGGAGDASRVAAGRLAYSGNDEARSGTTVSVLASLDGAGIGDGVAAELTWFSGRPQIVVLDRQQRMVVYDGATGQRLQLTESELRTTAEKLVPDARMTSWTRVEAGDAYWYSHHVTRKLPVYRAQFDDADRTWAYIDPDSGNVLARVTHANRLDRWLFGGLHRLDFRWLIAHRPAWDIVMWTLSLAGLLLSATGVVIGWRRLRRTGGN